MLNQYLFKTNTDKLLLATPADLEHTLICLCCKYFVRYSKPRYHIHKIPGPIAHFCHRIQHFRVVRQLLNFPSIKAPMSVYVRAFLFAMHTNCCLCTSTTTYYFWSFFFPTRRLNWRWNAICIIERIHKHKNEICVFVVNSELPTQHSTHSKFESIQHWQLYRRQHTMHTMKWTEYWDEDLANV